MQVVKKMCIERVHRWRCGSWSRDHERLPWLCSKPNTV